jgi:hypothetical protein
MAALAAQGIATAAYYPKPLHRQAAYSRAQWLAASPRRGTDVIPMEQRASS